MIDAKILKDKISMIDYLKSKGVEVEKHKKAFSCPFHIDEHPSANVYMGKKGYECFKCFSCGLHGDLLLIASKYENILSFYELCNFLAEKYEVRN